LHTCVDVAFPQDLSGIYSGVPSCIWSTCGSLLQGPAARSMHRGLRACGASGACAGILCSFPSFWCASAIPCFSSGILYTAPHRHYENHHTRGRALQINARYTCASFSWLCPGDHSRGAFAGIVYRTAAAHVFSGGTSYYNFYKLWFSLVAVLIRATSLFIPVRPTFRVFAISLGFLPVSSMALTWLCDMPLSNRVLPILITSFRHRSMS